MKELKTSEVLDLAADAIKIAGWGQGVETWEGDHGKGLCLEGGIAAAVGESAYFAGGRLVDTSLLQKCPAYAAVQEYLDFNTNLWVWNDTYGRTQQEVIEVLRAAAAVERTKEAVAGYSTDDQPLPLEVGAA